MPLQLAIAQPDGIIREHLLFAGRHYVIGRAATSDIVIDSAQVSRRHATFHANSEDIWTCKNVSSSGCFNNGVPMDMSTLHTPTVLHFGPVPCRITPLTSQALVKNDSHFLWRKQQLARFKQQINACSNTRELIDTARECLLQTLGCERAAFILYDSHSGFESSIGYPAWMDADSFTGTRTVIRRCMASGKMLTIGDIQQDQTLNTQQSILQHGIKAAICIPVKVDHEVVGVLYGDNTQNRLYYSDNDCRVAAALAQFLSLRLLFQSIEHKISLAVCS